MADRRLRRTVRGDQRRRAGRLTRGDVEDHAAPPGHCRRFGVAADVRGEEVAFDDRRRVLDRGVEERSRDDAAGHPDVVDRDVEVPMRGDDPVDGRGDRRTIADIGHRRFGAQALPAQLGRKRVSAPRVDVVHPDVRARLGEPRGNGPADARPGARHEGDASCEINGDHRSRSSACPRSCIVLEY
jgi:hypothetical protein